MTVSAFLLCLLGALVLGVLTALVFSFRSEHSGNLPFALVLVPPIVTLVIMMVNGSIGVGVAIAGAFSLVRFRSAQGSAKEIAVIFMAMCSGLIVGVGYLAYAILFTIVMCLVLVALHVISAKNEASDATRLLKISIPESLDYEGVFNDLFDAYASSHKLLQVRTASMGSIFKLTYEVTLKKGASEKELLDALRVRNGNLEVSLGKPIDNESEL